jgi:hypothetical protein
MVPVHDFSFQADRAEHRMVVLVVAIIADSTPSGRPNPFSIRAILAEFVA